MSLNSSAYIGRFAPSPSGPLHFGSLIAALGSYLRAKQQQGKWLVRIEDIDPPREVAGASSDILTTLEAYGLHWDDTELFQSHRLDIYQQHIEQLLKEDLSYFCHCTRKKIQQMGGVYDSRCGQLRPRLTQGAVRIRNSAQVEHFTDLVMGSVTVKHSFAAEDFIIKRSDGLYAYQLAVVLDDAFQQITEIVRGCDLLETSCRQISMNNILGFNSPNWLHLPLACTKPGFKLSKQNYANAIDRKRPQASINAALRFLGQQQVDIDDVDVMLKQAAEQFAISQIPQLSEILIEQ
ncbi:MULTISPECIES: tRNA glutamyl-Q(34) synthetase GluQRS [unclassified Shewanella]|uniref:tRNA glutamyl-Q(34) synthetase GluQRS n=1 Tax=unclassified Shewanella TaxID=196818 RepID=UPI000C8278A3|nr:MULTISPECIES: tRNA glutamyl-Q(34) synthetase GluQRS [unclassified Shewanella]MDO6618028.1 tRNA glutamyl-Q(34) synthetase GluQRS [Shewanella sp. 6_MG-2023]MDO6640987.1 tRNA glutamyl-Q(34) synthetase GluQRS [Shewanella sp. 5_MG-2023]MDO6679187.1 tRNA glutamyl-Q(34) synthetase GluQRS [Shewanella sp. 4_MG-2023]MDO6776488.1 tRNA glutamyl-Q(34) synthetase GluQRS [Shewanella sp. 3_MG-2023]PMG30720.1 tRNA glutamyl-Q(34) synthetase GluQRS [Shewanella sp. 10N.286.52.C2]